MSETRSSRVRTKSAINWARLCFPALLLLQLAFGPSWVFAQAPDTTVPQRQPTRPPVRRSNIDARVSNLTKTLELTPEQQSAVRKILEQRQQETLEIRRDPAISGSARIERFRMLQEGTVQRIRTVLNEEQKKKYDPMAASHNQTVPEHSVEDWLKASSPK
jgi:hypothetical protein